MTERKGWRESKGQRVKEKKGEGRRERGEGRKEKRDGEREQGTESKGEK